MTTYIATLCFILGLRLFLRFGLVYPTGRSSCLVWQSVYFAATGFVVGVARVPLFQVAGKVSGASILWAVAFTALIVVVDATLATALVNSEAGRRSALVRLRADHFASYNPVIVGVLCFLAASWEETFFRALPIYFVRESAPLVVMGVAVVTTIAFGLMHCDGGLQRVGYSMVFGLVFMVFYLLSGSLLAVIAAHGGGNAFVLLNTLPRLEKAEHEKRPCLY